MTSGETGFGNVTVFYVWQSDIGTARNRVTKAIDSIAEDLSDSRTTVVIDQDTRSATGALTIDHVILDRIAAADVVVADVTPVGQTSTAPPGDVDSSEEAEEAKLLPNANVMFEVGFAFASVGPERVVLVRDIASGLDGLMPFDVRNREILHFESPSSLKKLLKEKVVAILTRGPSLPGEPGDRASVVRMLDDLSLKGRRSLASEFALLAADPDDVWNELSDYFRRNNRAPSKWDDKWHYGENTEAHLLRDLRISLVPASRQDQRSAARQRIEKYLAGVRNLAKRNEFLRIGRPWLPPVGYHRGGDYHQPKTVEMAGEWLQQAEEFSATLNKAYTEAVEAHEALVEAPSTQTVTAFVNKIRVLLSRLHSSDPCPTQSD